jgi:hypothetical protein
MSFNRQLQDAKLRATNALPAQDTNNNGDSLDLGQVELGPTGDHLELQVSLPATPDLANGQTITLTIQDSADGTTFATLAGLSTIVATGAGGLGAAAIERIVRLPRTTRRYVRVNAAASATAGDNTGVSRTIAILI